jgi:hypothetical protein
VQSEFGKGVACLGQTMKELGHEHAELVRDSVWPCDDDDDSLLRSHATVMMLVTPQENKIGINTINPLKAYRDGDLKEIANLKKRYLRHRQHRTRGASACRAVSCLHSPSLGALVLVVHRYESNRLEYDTAKRVYQSKNTPENEDKMNRVRMRYEEVRDAYYELLQHSQDDDHKHLEHLKAYARAMVCLSSLLARPPRARPRCSSVGASLCLSHNRLIITASAWRSSKRQRRSSRCSRPLLVRARAPTPTTQR